MSSFSKMTLRLCTLFWLHFIFVADGKVNTPQPLFIGSRPIFGFNGQHLMDEMETSDDSKYEKYLAQTLDHFSDSDKRTFQQRYFVNTQWKSDKNGAVHILWLEGDGAANSYTVTNDSLPHVSLAKDLGATAWALEHRFYGKSQPFKDRPVSNMVFLSSKQAVEDIADFIKSRNKASSESNPKWIVIGSSYGGSLVLWFRRKYPSLTIGAVSDSAAVSPTIDFWSYEKLVEEVYANYTYECWHGIKFAALAIRNEIQYVEGVERMNKELNIQPPVDDNRVENKDFQNLHHNIIKLFEIPVLYNGVNIGPFANCCGVVELCKILSLEDGGSDGDVERVYEWAKHLYSHLPGRFTGIHNDYDAVVAYVNDTKFDENKLAQASARSWLWQQCTEFGQFISTDAGYGLFSSSIPNDYFIGLCDAAFEQSIRYDSLKSAIKNTTKAFDTSHYFKGTNTLIFNGQLDPWKTLGVNSTQESSSTFYLVPDMGRGAVLQPPTQHDPSSLTRARKYLFQRKVSSWVKAGNNKQSKTEEKQSEPNLNPQEQSTSKFQEIRDWNAEIVDHTHPLHNSLIREHAQSSKSRSEFVGNRPELPGASNKKATQFEPVYMQTNYMKLKVDHFGSANQDTFLLRYFLNKQHQRDSDGPRFLMLAGQEEISFWYRDNYMDTEYSFHNWAVDFKAVMYVLETRYFGNSRPYRTTTVEHLQYLTTEQAVSDVAIFINTINKYDQLQNLTTGDKDARWVLFGGNYGGTLAACLRVRFPELSVGAVASSAIMEARVDIPDLMQRTQDIFVKYAGSNCTRHIYNYFEWLRRKLNTRPGRLELKTALCILNDWDMNYVEEKDVQYFLYYEGLVLTRFLYNDYEDSNRGTSWFTNWCEREYGKYEYYWNGEMTQNGVPEGRNPMLSDVQRQKLVALAPWMEMEVISGWTSYSMDKQRNQQSEAELYNHHSSEMSAEEFREKNSDFEALKHFAKPDNDVSANYTDPDDPSQEYDFGPEPPECNRTVCPYGCTLIDYNLHLGRLESFQDFGGNTKLWQQCTEWGRLLTTNFPNIMGSTMPINFPLDMCTDMFGEKFNRNTMEGGVRHMNYLWGGQDQYNGTNVIFVHASMDPLAILEVHDPLHPSSISIMINGSKNCEDMARQKRSDSKALRSARRTIKKTLIKWLRRW